MGHEEGRTGMGRMGLEVRLKMATWIEIREERRSERNEEGERKCR